jgi:hypothetical protein
MRRMPALAALTAAVALSLIAAPALAAPNPKFEVSPTLVRAGQRVAGSADTNELQVLDPATTEPAVAARAFGPQPISDLALWVALFAGGTLLVAAIRVGRRRRS